MTIEYREPKRDCICRGCGKNIKAKSEELIAIHAPVAGNYVVVFLCEMCVADMVKLTVGKHGLSWLQDLYNMISATKQRPRKKFQDYVG